MAVDVVTSFPSNLMAGTTLRVTLGGGTYPATSWTGHMGIVGPGVDLQLEATADGSDHAFVISGSDTGAFPPGEYMYHFLVEETLTGEKQHVKSEPFTVSRNPLSKVPYVSPDERMLNALREYQAGRMEQDAAETFSIDGQSFTHTSAREISRQIRIYEVKVKLERDRERRRSTGEARRNVRFTFR